MTSKRCNLFDNCYGARLFCYMKYTKTLPVFRCFFSVILWVADCILVGVRPHALVAVLCTKKRWTPNLLWVDAKNGDVCRVGGW